MTRSASAEQENCTGALLVALEDVVGDEGETVGPRADLGEVVVDNVTEAGKAFGG